MRKQVLVSTVPYRAFNASRLQYVLHVRQLVGTYLLLGAPASCLQHVPKASIWYRIHPTAQLFAVSGSTKIQQLAVAEAIAQAINSRPPMVHVLKAVCLGTMGIAPTTA